LLQYFNPFPSLYVVHVSSWSKAASLFVCLFVSMWVCFGWLCIGTRTLRRPKVLKFSVLIAFNLPSIILKLSRKNLIINESSNILTAVLNLIRSPKLKSVVNYLVILYNWAVRFVPYANILHALFLWLVDGEFEVVAREKDKIL
jgi:hypothetical protein